MTGAPSDEAMHGSLQPDGLLSAFESANPSSVWVAQLRQDVIAVHGYPLDAWIEPLPGVHFHDDASQPVGR